MKSISKQPNIKDTVAPAGKQRSYNEVIEFLDKQWSVTPQPNLQTIKKLDTALGSISQKLNTILVTGSNGKSLTIHFAAKLLRAEGLTVGSFSSPHMLTYNERMGINSEAISNKTFTEVGNEVLNTAEGLGLNPSAHELLTMMALLYFANNKADIVLLEPFDPAILDATAICAPKIVAVTRVTPDKAHEKAVADLVKNMLSIVKPGTTVVSADQSKLNLQLMHDVCGEKQGSWAMPIRKLAPLEYPFEQLHGRCAALAERIAHVYINEWVNKDASVIGTGSLLTKQKGQRGRPSLEAKKQSELNPQKTMEQFWKEEHASMPSRFQLLDKEKPTLLLDNANNLDAFKNLLLGVRLLHYQRPLKGLTLILGCNNGNIDLNELLKLLRYFFKKTSGQVIVCPVASVPGQKNTAPWDIEKVTNDIKGMKIKARSTKDFKEAFEAAQKSVDERHGLVIITGSSAVITEYWLHKGIKKL